MSHAPFDRVIIIGRPSGEGVPETLVALIEYLERLSFNYKIEQQTSDMLPESAATSARKQHIIELNDLQPANDLLLVIGGDGSMIHASRHALKHDLPLIGINRGQVGFLTDIAPTAIELIGPVLQGAYQTEKRFMLSATVIDDKGKVLPEGNCSALNDVVLTPGNVAHMISFSITIDGQPVCSQRADGLIVATPTGSTAYALSAGGPIVHPKMKAIVLVPMLPHKLSSRPIVVGSSSTINITIDEATNHSPSISSDGGRCIRIQPGYQLQIEPCTHRVTLVHPESYQYYATLRQKLGWERI